MCLAFVKVSRSIKPKILSLLIGHWVLGIAKKHLGSRQHNSQIVTVQNTIKYLWPLSIMSLVLFQMESGNSQVEKYQLLAYLKSILLFIILFVYFSKILFIKHTYYSTSFNRYFN